LSNYTGEPNGFIRIYVTDDFRVKQVRIRIETGQSDVVETGFVEQEGDNN